MPTRDPARLSKTAAPLSVKIDRKPVARKSVRPFSFLCYFCYRREKERKTKRLLAWQPGNQIRMRVREIVFSRFVLAARRGAARKCEHDSSVRGREACARPRQRMSEALITTTPEMDVRQSPRHPLLDHMIFLLAQQSFSPRLKRRAEVRKKVSVLR